MTTAGARLTRAEAFPYDKIRYAGARTGKQSDAPSWKGERGATEIAANSNADWLSPLQIGPTKFFSTSTRHRGGERDTSRRARRARTRETRIVRFRSRFTNRDPRARRRGLRRGGARARHRASLARRGGTGRRRRRRHHLHHDVSARVHGRARGAARRAPARVLVRAPRVVADHVVGRDARRRSARQKRGDDEARGGPIQYSRGARVRVRRRIGRRRRPQRRRHRQRPRGVHRGHLRRQSGPLPDRLRGLPSRRRPGRPAHDDD